VFTNEDDDVAYESSILYDDVPVEKSIPSLHGHATAHTTRCAIVHGCSFRNVHRFAYAFGRLVLDNQKDGQGADGKARENAYGDARSTPIQTLT
jgi:hypothetical protein